MAPAILSLPLIFSASLLVLSAPLKVSRSFLSLNTLDLFGMGSGVCSLIYSEKIHMELLVNQTNFLRLIVILPFYLLF